MSTERAVVFGRAGSLVGVLTEAKDGHPDESTLGVILINAGVVHHVGPHRLYVDLARLLSERGRTVLRFDHSGVGDSPARDDHLPFAESSVIEVHDAMDWLKRERGCTRFVLLGLCSGTLTAFRTASRDPRVVGLVLLTSLLEDPSTVSEEVIQQAVDRRITRSYTSEKAFDAKSWKKLVTGQANYRQIARVLAKRIQFFVARPRKRAPRSSEVVVTLGTLLERGVSVLFIFGEPTTVLEYFRMTVEPFWNDLVSRGRIALHVLQRSDHTFSASQHRQRIFELITEWLTAFQSELEQASVAGPRSSE